MAELASWSPIPALPRCLQWSPRMLIARKMSKRQFTSTRSHLLLVAKSVSSCAKHQMSLWVSRRPKFPRPRKRPWTGKAVRRVLQLGPEYLRLVLSWLSYWLRWGQSKKRSARAQCRLGVWTCSRNGCCNRRAGLDSWCKWQQWAHECRFVALWCLTSRSKRVLGLLQLAGYRL